MIVPESPASADAENLSLCVPRQSFRSDANPGGKGASDSALIVASDIPNTTEENHVVIKVDRFGFSANNITYQALGEMPHFRYFEFHKVPETKQTTQKSHGLIPVWGFGTIVWSSHKRIEVGERVYGYFAPARYLLLPVSPNDVNKYSFFVPRPHFPPDRRPYNQVTRCRFDPQYDPDPEVEDLTMLYRPLFWTSFWCEDWLAASSFRSGATSFLISSASSKTAFCFAYLVRKRFARNASSSTLRIVGLTSSKNTDFTKGLGLYDDVVDYTSLASCRPSLGKQSSKWIYVDVAGADSLNVQIRSFFATSREAILLAQISLGLTNLSPSAPSSGTSSWSQNTQLLESSKVVLTPDIQSHDRVDATDERGPGSLPDPEPFFMPEWLILRKKQLSVAEITKMQDEAWRDLMRECREWVKCERSYGGEEVLKAYNDVVKNGVGPDKGLIWSLWNEKQDVGRSMEESRRRTETSKL